MSTTPVQFPVQPPPEYQRQYSADDTWDKWAMISPYVIFPPPAKEYSWGKMAFWFASGVWVRGFALAAQHRPFFFKPLYHAVFGGAFVGAGYQVHKWQVNKFEYLELRVKKLVLRRQQRLQAAAAGE
ncbi:hypothetical protein HDV00_006033 [Rhizophlyctis rosea]|nr:hypothetical protein HDV00_006033 [Rhizophlyctis rosea]